jgi:mRNA interferase RelE/StbE
MATYSVRILKPAIRDLERLDKSTGHRITQRILWLSKYLDSIKPVALKGELAGLFKLREGDYRIFYQIIHNEKLIFIHSIGHRKNVYRNKK